MIMRDTKTALSSMQIEAWRWLAAAVWRLSRTAERAGCSSVSVLLADRAVDCAEQVELHERAERDGRHAEEWRAEFARALAEGAA